MMPDRRLNALIGLLSIAVLGLLGFGVYLYLGGVFKAGFPVDAFFARAGQNLRSGSDVKLRGVLVGTVEDVEVTREGKARVRMNLFPDNEIPSNVNAAIRAKTLFGEKFIELRSPAEPSGRLLRAGDEIPESRTIPPLEVETILEKAVPLLNAVDPVMFSAAAHALAEAFVGNEEALRRATLQGERVLVETERTLPSFERNLGHLRTFAGALDEADQDLLRALDGLEKVGGVLDQNAGDFRRTLGSLTGLTRDLADVTTARRQDLVDLSVGGAKVLECVTGAWRECDRRRSPADLPKLVDALTGFLGAWISDLTNAQGRATGMWRILITSEPAQGNAYGPGQEPRPADAAAPRRDVIGRLADVPGAPSPGLVDILLAPVPDEAVPPLVDRLTDRTDPKP